MVCIAGASIVKYYCSQVNRKFGSTILGPLFVIVMVIMTVVGLVTVPLVKVYKFEYKELSNYQVIKSPDAVIIDLTNSNAKTGYYKLVKFNTYRAVMEFGDSTKIFEKIEKGFYGDVLYRSYVWSNPPYKYFNRE